MKPKKKLTDRQKNRLEKFKLKTELMEQGNDVRWTEDGNLNIVGNVLDPLIDEIKKRKLKDEFDEMQ